MGFDAPQRYLLAALLAAGLGELLLLRFFSRVGFHIPKSPEAALAFRSITSVGSFAFNLATVLTPLALLLLLLPALRWSRGAHRPAKTAPAALTYLLLGYLLLGVLRPWAGGGEGVGVAFGLLTVALLLLIALPAVAAPVGVPLASRVALGAIVGAYLCSQYYAVAIPIYQLLGQQGPPATTGVLAAGEALVVVAGVAAFGAWGWPRLSPKATRRGERRSRAPWVLAAALALASASGGLAAKADASTLAILTLWSLGLTLYLPLPLYVVALVLYGVTVVACLRDRTEEGFYVGIGLALLPIAGYVLEMSYQHLLAVLVVLLLARGPSYFPFHALPRRLAPQRA